jgi:hypothetical protein
MCNNISPNHFLPNYGHIKYPYSNLERPHMYYVSLVDELFRSFYGFLNYFVTYDRQSIIIGINDVNPSPIYNPFDFDPKYRVITSNDDDYYIIERNIFDMFYSYFPDIVPYLSIELHQPYYNSITTFGCFTQINFKQLFYDCENRKRYNTLTPF